MKRFLKLLQKDLEASRLPVAFLSGITLAIMVFFRYKISSGAWPVEAAVGAVAIPAMFLPLWLMWQSFQTLRSEWREDTVYTLLVLPVPGWQVMLAKLVSICAEYTVLFVVAVAGAFSFFWGLLEPLFTILPSISWLLWNMFLLYLASLIALAGFVIFVQLAFVVSKMVGRLQGLVSIWTLVLANWAVTRLAVIIEPLFRWIPAIPLHSVFRLQELERNIVLELNLAPHIGLFLGSIAVFCLTSYLFENYVEING